MQPLPEILHHHLQPILQLHLGLPSQQCLSLGNIRLTSRWIIRSICHKGNLHFGVDHRLDHLGQLNHGEFSGVADIERTNVLFVIHHCNHALDEVLNVLEGSGLLTIAKDGEWLVLEGLSDKVGDDTAVIEGHFGAVCVEDTNDADFKAVFTVVVHSEALSSTFTFIIAGTLSNWVHIAPVFFSLRVLKRISVNFRSGGDEEAGSATLGKAQHVHSANETSLDGLDWVVLVMDWRGRASEVEDLINLEEDWLDDVMSDEFKVGAADEVSDIFLAASEEVVKADDMVATVDEEFTEVGADKAGTTSDEDTVAFHTGLGLDGWAITAFVALSLGSHCCH